MKVGIITYHRAHNYGAVLQAYALKHHLMSLGCEVDIIDYWPNYRDGMYDLVDLRFLDSKRGGGLKVVDGLKSFLKLIMTYPSKKERFDRFESFILTELVACDSQVIRSGKDLPEEHDLYIYGSDQIWRNNNFINFSGYDGVYWGQYPKVPGVRKVTYAASMGIINDTPQARNFLSDNIENFSRLSVRERSLGDWIYSETGMKSKQVLDPAFLLSKEEWDEVSDQNKTFPERYILFYNLNRVPEATRLVSEMASKYDCEVIELSGTVYPFKPSRRCMQTAGPREFLALFKNATQVVSTSFHGVVFSLIFQKQFFALGMGDNAARVTDLLGLLGISERYLKSFEKAIPVSTIDYNVVSPLLEHSKKESMEFLLNALGSVASIDSLPGGL